jgi:hypothetical protein
MRKSRIAAAKRTKNIIYGVLALAFVALVIAVSIYYSVHRDSPLDKSTMCPSPHPKGHVVLLIDKTDPLTFIQKQSFLTFLVELTQKGVEPGALLSVFVIGENYKDSAKPVFELCNPGRGEGKSELTANLNQLTKQYEQGFREPVLKLAGELQASEPAKFSPIFEMTQLVAVNGFRRTDIEGNRRLIIFSDMLHNTPQFSMYRGNADFQAFKDSDYGKKLAVDLKGVEVELRYIMNSPKLQNRRHLQFWEQYFSNAGARVMAVTPMEG